jgi:hypothetical protein
VILAITVVVHCESHAGGRYRRIFIVGSAFVPLLIGVAEQSSMNTIVLTDMPWCVTLGILMDKLVHSIAYRGSDRSKTGDTSKKQNGRDTKKNSMTYRGSVEVRRLDYYDVPEV